MKAEIEKNSSKIYDIKNKKKILFLISSLKRGGGAERVLSSLTFKLSEKYNIFIITFRHFKQIYSYEGNHISLKENYGKFHKFLKVLRLNLILRPFKIYELIKLISPDLFISLVDSTNFFAIITKIIFRIKIPLIVANHCNPKIRYKKKLNVFNFLIKLLYPLNSVNKIITISEEIKNTFIKYYGIKSYKIIKISNGIDINKITKMKNEKIIELRDLFNKKEIIKFINIGRLEEVKGHKYLIKAFSITNSKISNSKLIIIGKGSLKKPLLDLTKKLKLEKNIKFLGAKRNPFKYLGESDIFVLSSISEGLPMTLLESLACGLPIISTDCKTGPREILDNGKFGLLVKIMNSKDLAENMISLAKNVELRTKFSQLALKRAKIYDINKIKVKWIELIESILI